MSKPITFDTVFLATILEDIQTIEEYIVQNKEKHENSASSYVPLYSYEYKIEKKYLKKLWKAHVEVFNYNSFAPYPAHK